MNILKNILDENIIIETERLKIYPFRINFKTIEDLFAIYSKSTNVENYCTVHHNFDDFNDYIRRKIENFQIIDNGIISFTIELKENSKIIGVRNIILDGIYTNNGNREINNKNIITEILIKEEHWRKGFAFEASNALFKFLKTKGIENILAFVNSKDKKADNLDEKLGFKYTSLEEAINQFNYHKDFGIHGYKTNQTHILLKTL